jgi:hypothetical protein
MARSVRRCSSQERRLWTCSRSKRDTPQNRREASIRSGPRAPEEIHLVGRKHARRPVELGAGSETSHTHLGPLTSHLGGDGPDRSLVGPSQFSEAHMLAFHLYASGHTGGRSLCIYYVRRLNRHVYRTMGAQ